MQVKATNINPVDWKMAQIGFAIQKFPIVLGCDVAGVVEATGADVKDFKKGDEVFSFTPLGTPGCGTFAEYCVTPSDLVLRKTANLSFEAASTIPVSLETAALGLYHYLKVPEFPGHVVRSAEIPGLWSCALPQKITCT